MSSKKIPNFFIVGGPKCGTTSLSEYLRQHSNVFFTYQKEPHYWASDLPRDKRITTLENYVALFDNIQPEHVAYGEGSVWTLYSKVALSRIHEFNPDAKIIVMLRNPLEVALSLHSFWFSISMEDQMQFEKAWNMQQERSEGKSLPRASKVKELYLYRDIGMFGEQLTKALAIFPKDQIKIVFFEDFVKDTKKIYDEILTFIGVTNLEEKIDFEVHNENQTYRSSHFANLVRKVPTLLEPYINKFKQVTGIKNLRIMTYVKEFEKKFNSKPGKRKTIDNELKKTIISEFYDDIKIVEEITNRDLSHWYKEIL